MLETTTVGGKFSISLNVNQSINGWRWVLVINDSHGRKIFKGRKRSSLGAYKAAVSKAEEVIEDYDALPARDS